MLSERRDEEDATAFFKQAINNCCIQHKFVDIFINDTYIQVAV
jgi:transposase-like protein